jgi:hypothetical protein
MSRWARRGTYCPVGWKLVDRVIGEASQDRTITVAEGLEDQVELGYLMFKLRCLENTHNENVMEVGWELQSCRHAETLENLLASDELKIQGHRQISHRVQDVDARDRRVVQNRLGLCLTRHVFHATLASTQCLISA